VGALEKRASETAQEARTTSVESSGTLAVKARRRCC
jgi:hypothetical protein